RLGSLTRESVGAGEDELGAAAEADAIDRGNGGNGQLLEPPEQPLPRARLRLRFSRVRDRDDRVYVRTGDEAAILAAPHDQRAHGVLARLLLDRAEQLLEALHRRLVQQVDLDRKSTRLNSSHVK